MTNNNNNHDKDDDDNNVHAMPSSKKKKKKLYSNSANRFLPQLNTRSKSYLSQTAILKHR